MFNVVRLIPNLMYDKKWTRKIAGIVLLIGCTIIAIALVFFLFLLSFFIIAGLIALFAALLGHTT